MIEEASLAQNNPPESNEIYTAPMSFAQQRLWFMDQLYPDSQAYTRAFLYRLTGQLNIDNTMLAGEASDLSPRIQLKKMDRPAHRREKPQDKR